MHKIVDTAQAVRRGRQDGALPAHGAGRGGDDAVPHGRGLFDLRQRWPQGLAAPHRAGRGSRRRRRSIAPTPAIAAPARPAFSGADGPDVSPAGEQIIDPITAYQIDTMLEGVVLRGTGVAAQVLGRPIGGKTGTTNDFRSAWFVGFSPQIVVATYIGFDDNRSLGKGETGAVAALPIFIEFMQEALKGLPADGLQGSAEHQVRQRRPQPRGLPPRHRASAESRRRGRASATTRATRWSPPRRRARRSPRRAEPPAAASAA